MVRVVGAQHHRAVGTQLVDVVKGRVSRIGVRDSPPQAEYPVDPLERQYVRDAGLPCAVRGEDEQTVGQPSRTGPNARTSKGTAGLFHDHGQFSSNRHQNWPRSWSTPEMPQLKVGA